MIDKMNNTAHKSFKKNIVWNIAGTIGSKFFVMIAAVLIARILGADKNGEFSMINNTIGMFSTIAALGLGTTATKFIAEFKGNEKKRCGKIMALTSLLALASSLFIVFFLVFYSDWIAKVALNNEGLSLGVRISSLMLFFNTLNTIQFSTLSGLEDFKTLARVSIFQGLISLPIFVLLTIFNGVNGLIFGYGLVGFISWLLMRFRIKNLCKSIDVRPNYRECLQEYRILVKFAIPSLLMNILVIPVTWLGNTMVINDVGGYYELGVFNAANQWKMAITLLPTAIGNVILPYLISNSNDERMEDINIMLSWVIVTAISSAVIVTSCIITLLYGNNYPFVELNASIILICLTCMLLSFKEGISRNLIRFNYMWFGFFSNFTWGISYLVLIFLLKQYGAIGISLSTFGSYFITTLIFIPFYITKGIVNKKYIANRKVILLWCAFLIQVIVSLYFDSFIIKLSLAIFVLVFLYKITDDLFSLKSIMVNLLRKKV